MKEKIANFFLFASIFIAIAATFFLWKKVDPFYTYYFLYIWWPYILAADSWLYRHGGESIVINQPVWFINFLVPFSAFFWFIFEAFNLRLHNWHYINIPREIWIRWPSNFIAFGTVLPGIFVTSNLLDHFGLFRKNEFSAFFPPVQSKVRTFGWMGGGALMLLLPIFFPKYFFPLVWGGFVLLLDPINALWGRRSLLQEWKQGNWNRTLQLLIAGAVCGGLWELWNFWSGAKWVYSFSLPHGLSTEFKFFEMPVLGFLGFPPFALECFAALEFARGLRERTLGPAWKILVLFAFLFSISTCYFMDRYTVQTFR